MSPPSISIITATYNSELVINDLIESLLNQEDKKFEWVVVDGQSTDRTLEILRDVEGLNIKIISEPDFGIYDALNKGINACTGDFYLIAGADDIFYSDAISKYKNKVNKKSQLITAFIKSGDKILKPKGGPSWRFAQLKWVSAHALGLLIKKDLHEKYGWYSKEFPIAADQLFIKKCCQNDVLVEYIDDVLGEFGQYGVSSTNIIGTCTEYYRIQLITESNKWLVTVLFIIRLLRRLRYIK